jgi:hypothetical protein
MSQNRVSDQLTALFGDVARPESNFRCLGAFVVVPLLTGLASWQTALYETAYNQARAAVEQSRGIDIFAVSLN